MVALQGLAVVQGVLLILGSPADGFAIC
ncbi:hypothetical protein PSAC2689_190117 [Paraburkholderia sacchari]